MGEAIRRATYEDLLAAPEHQTAELIDGRLYLQARPRVRHAQFVGSLHGALMAQHGDDQPVDAQWVILSDVELHFGDDVLVPDMAGWVASRYPYLEGDEDPQGIVVSPDWVLEVLSPSTASKDRTKKLPVYHREGVRHVWLFDPAATVLEVYARLGDGGWRLINTHDAGGICFAAPFLGVALDLDRLVRPRPPAGVSR